MKAEIQGLLALPPNLSRKARTATVVSTLQSSSLLSLGKLCDDGCQVLLDNDWMIAVKKKKVVVKGVRNRNDGLWDIPIDPYPKEKIQHKTYQPPTTHAAMYSTIKKKPVEM